MQILYSCNLFKSKPNINASMRNDSRLVCIHLCKAHVYHYSLILSSIAGLKPGRVKCLHFVSVARADHPLGPLIFFTDADKLIESAHAVLRLSNTLAFCYLLPLTLDCMNYLERLAVDGVSKTKLQMSMSLNRRGS